MPSSVKAALAALGITVAAASTPYVAKQIIIVSPPPVMPAAPTYFYVDFARTANGDGSEANPWKARSNIVWATVTSALSSGPVTIYFSSRATWSDNQQLVVNPNTNTTTNRLTLDGQSKYNLTASGAAAWAVETVAENKAVLGTAGGTGGTVYVYYDNQFVTVRGFNLVNPTNGGINIGVTFALSKNFNDIVIENNIIDSPVNFHGIWVGYAQEDVYNITIRKNTVINAKSEAIYVGYYAYLADTITGVVVEYNTVINAGLTGEGDIDIKPGCFGAIVRYNIVYSLETGRVLAGIAVGASDVQVYGNELYNLNDFFPLTVGGGDGIMINADGDGAGNGKTLANVIAYNNLIYGNAQNGISVYATTTNAVITNLTIMNNTIAGNGERGLFISSSASRPITVSKLKNNAIFNNVDHAIHTGGNVTLTEVNNNLYLDEGTAFRHLNIDRTWAQWQALGFDANGLNTDPLLDASYLPTAGSPVIGAGSVETEFTIDKAGTVRGVAWDIGAYERVP